LTLPEQNDIVKLIKQNKEIKMAHELEEQNGKTSFASFREPAWHGLGTVFTEEKNTTEMLQAANLDNWNVRLEEMNIPNHLSCDKNYSYVVRTNPTNNTQTDVLGVVGERYVPLQNEDLFSFGDNILDGGGRWETAGVRVVCANTLNLALGGRKKKNGIKQSFKIRHTQTANGKVQIAREALGLANSYMDEFDKMAHAMISQEVTAKQFNDILLTAYPKPELDKKASVTKWTNKIDSLNDIYTGQFNNMIAGTAWGAFNALTERLDWYRSARGENTENMLIGASGFDPAINAEKNRLLKVVQDVMQLA